MGTFGSCSPGRRRHTRVLTSPCTCIAVQLSKAAQSSTAGGGGGGGGELSQPGTPARSRSRATTASSALSSGVGAAVQGQAQTRWEPIASGGMSERRCVDRLLLLLFFVVVFVRSRSRVERQSGSVAKTRDGKMPGPTKLAHKVLSSTALD